MAYIDGWVAAVPETNRAAAEAAMEVLIDVAKTRIFSAAHNHSLCLRSA